MAYLNGKNCLIAAILSAIVLALAFIPLSGSQTSMSYDPWADINDDGKIDIKDVAYTARLSGTSGDPTKPVVITGYNWKTLYYEINVPPLSYGLLDIPTAGYSAITLGLNAYGNNPHKTDKYLYVSTSFRIEKQYQYVETLSLKIPGMGISYIPIPWNRVYVEPGYVGYNASIVNTVGKRFNVTAKTYLTNIYTFRLVLYYNSQVLKNTKVWLPWYVSGITSYSTYLIWNIIIIDGKLLATPITPFMLAGYEFEVTSAPEQNQTITSPLIIGKDVPEGAQYVTWFRDSYGNTIDYTWSNGLFEYYTITKYDTTYMITRTYDVKGTTLRLRYNNPNDFNIKLHIGAHLTTAP
jgi:hypothetical protein